MAFTEEQVAQALGVGAKAQEIADPAQNQTPTEIHNDPTGTEPGAEGGQPTEQPQTEPTTGAVDDERAGAGGGGKEPLSEQQRRENAARRRQQEQQAAIDSAVEAAKAAERERINAQTKSFFENAKITNNFTGQPITNMEEFMEWQTQHKKAQLEEGLKSGNLSAELLDQAISQHPVVQKAQEIIEKNTTDSAAAQAAAMEAKVKAEIAEITKLDPSIQSVADLKNMPNFQQFYELVGKNYSFIDAYRLVNFDRLTAQAAQAGLQQAAANARSKEHLQASGNSRGAGAAAVPAAEMAMYRLMNPGATDAQIQTHYNKQKNN